MDNQTTENIEQNVARDVTSEVSSETPRVTGSNNGGIVAGIVVCAILGLGGLILGIVGLVNSNKALSVLSSNNIVYDAEMAENVIEEDVEPDTYVYVTYNNGNDFVSVGGNSILYSASDANGYSMEYSVEANTKELNQYVIDNYLSNLSGDNEIEESSWAIEISTADGNYAASGNEAAPDWFNDILNKFEVDKNGYLSRKIQNV